MKWIITEMLIGLEARVEKIIPRHTWNPQTHPLQAVLLEWKETPKEGPQIYQKLLNNSRMAAYFTSLLSSLVTFSTHAIVEAINEYQGYKDQERAVRGLVSYKQGPVTKGLMGGWESFQKAEVGLREAISSTRIPLSQLTRALTFHVDNK